MNGDEAGVLRVTACTGHEQEREVLSATHLPWTPQRRGPGEVRSDRAWARSSQVGAARIVDCTAAPAAGRRGPREIARTERIWVAAQIHLAGKCVLTGASTVIEPRPGRGAG